VSEAAESAPAPGLRGYLQAIGGRVRAALAAVADTVAVIVAVLRQSQRPLTWRRTVRAEFLYHSYAVGVRGVPAAMVTALVVGLAGVAQALYWLELAGQGGLIGQVLVLVVVREIAPLVVTFIVIGRSGSVMLVQLGRMQSQGDLRALDAMGLDPLLYLLVPRTLALALATFCLSIVFLATCLLSGYVAAQLLGLTAETPGDFVGQVLGAMYPADFAIVPFKTLLSGFAVGLVMCLTALSPAGAGAGPEERLPVGFVASVLVTLLISVAGSLLL
jgi:phospholipid/cholesterol/gamma-HCH transport system permease protein